MKTKKHSLIETQVADYLLSDYPPDTMSVVGLAKAVGKLMQLESAPEQLLTDTDLQHDNPRASAQDFADLCTLYSMFVDDNFESKQTMWEEKSALIEAYQQFAPVIAKLDMNGRPRLGNGSASVVYGLSMDGNEYAVRVPQFGDRQGIMEVDKHINAAILTSDLPHFERIIAASYQDKITVAHVVQGKHMRELEPGTIEHIPAEDIGDVYDAMKVAERRGVTFDVIGSNLLYDSEKDGFTVIDVSTENTGTYGSAAQFLYVNMSSIGRNITSLGIENAEGLRDAKNLRYMLEELEGVILDRGDTDDAFLPRITNDIDELDDMIHDWESVAA